MSIPVLTRSLFCSYDDDEYYDQKPPDWQGGRYENFEVRWTREPDFGLAAMHFRVSSEKKIAFVVNPSIVVKSILFLCISPPCLEFPL